MQKKTIHIFRSCSFVTIQVPACVVDGTGRDLIFFTPIAEGISMVAQHLGAGDAKEDSSPKDYGPHGREQNKFGVAQSFGLIILLANPAASCWATICMPSAIGITKKNDNPDFPFCSFLYILAGTSENPIPIFLPIFPLFSITSVPLWFHFLPS